MEMLRAEEQRLMEVCAQEVAAKAARSFAAVCRAPVVSSPLPPRNIGALLGDVPRTAAPVKKVPAVKSKPWFISLEHDYAAVKSWGEEAVKED
jgi:hypothetical protein